MYFESTELSGAPAGAEIEAVEPNSSAVGTPAVEAPEEEIAAEEIAAEQASAESDLGGAPANLIPALQRRGFERLTEVQRAVLDADDGKRDLRITSQTGSG